MHQDAALTPLAIAMGYLVRYGVPLLCAAIAVDAARRPAAALGRRARAVWIALPLALLVTLVAGFIVPGVTVLRLAAVASLPIVVMLGAAYLLSVVFARSSEPDGAPAGPSGP
ncbi:MAG: hypothetical protein ACNA76_08790 [Anaerosomatales bacterium]